MYLMPVIKCSYSLCSLERLGGEVHGLPDAVLVVEDVLEQRLGHARLPAVLADVEPRQVDEGAVTLARGR